jgi:hypothetical protein
VDHTALSGDIGDSDITHAQTAEAAEHDTADQSGDGGKSPSESGSDVDTQTPALDTAAQTCEGEVPKEDIEQAQELSVEGSGTFGNSGTVEKNTEQGEPKESASTAAPEESIAIGMSSRVLRPCHSHFISVCLALLFTRG